MTSSYISLFVHKKCISLFAFLIPLCFVKMGSTRKTCPKNCCSRKSEAGKSEWTPEMLWFCRPLGSNIANCSYHPKKYGEFSECRFSLIFHVREIVYMEHRDVQLWFFLEQSMMTNAGELLFSVNIPDPSQALPTEGIAKAIIHSWKSKGTRQVFTPWSIAL